MLCWIRFGTPVIENDSFHIEFQGSFLLLFRFFSMKWSRVVLGFVLLIFIVILTGCFDVTFNVYTPPMAHKESQTVTNP